MLCHPCILGSPQRQALGAKSRVVCHKGEQNQKWLTHSCLLGGPNEGGRVPNANSRGHATKRGLRVPNPNSRGHATGRGLRVPNPNPRGHATKRGSKKKKERKWEAKLHSRGSPTKGRKIRSVPQQRGTKSEVAACPGPKKGRKCHITPAFSGVPNIGKQNQKWLPHPYLLRGPERGGSAMSPLRSRGSPIPNKGTKSKVAHKWAEVLCKPYVLGGPRKGVQKGFKSGPCRAHRKNPIVGVLKGGP